MNLPSRLLEEAVEAFASLPGIGRKTALRLALHLYQQDAGKTASISEALSRFRNNISRCRECHNICDDDICDICANPSRDEQLLCVVEDLRDVIALENTHQYKGKYHVLGGIINPMEGVGPEDIEIDSLLNRIKNQEVRELIIALPSTMEGDTTTFYLSKRLTDSPIKISTLARGIPLGGELEYADELTLGRSLQERVDYKR